MFSTGSVTPLRRRPGKPRGKFPMEKRRAAERLDVARSPCVRAPLRAANARPTDLRVSPLPRKSARRQRADHPGSERRDRTHPQPSMTQLGLHLRRGAAASTKPSLIAIMLCAPSRILESESGAVNCHGKQCAEQAGHRFAPVRPRRNKNWR